MPKFQDKVGAENIDQYDKPLRRNKTALEATLTDLDVTLALTDPQLQSVINALEFSMQTAAELRVSLLDDRQAYVQQLRLFQLDTVALEFDELQPTYLLFDATLGGAVTSKCGEEVSDPAANVLGNAGKWAHLFDHSHEIVLDLGSEETIDGISIPIEAGSNATHQIRGADVYAAKALNKIDDAENKMLTAVDFATVDDNNEHLFSGEKKARYVKLTGYTTDNVNNNMRIKSILVRVVPKFFKEAEEA